MTDENTQNQVPEDHPLEPERPKTNRESRLDKLEARAAKARESETDRENQATGKTDAVDDIIESIESDEQKVSDSQENPVSVAEPVEEAEKRWTIKAKGQERQLTENELIAAAQKGIGADETFREAAAMRKEAMERLAQLQPTQPPPGAADRDPPEGGQISVEDWDAAIIDGDEKAREKLNAALRRLSVSEDDITNKALAQLQQAQRETEQQAAAMSFEVQREAALSAQQANPLNAEIYSDPKKLQDAGFYSQHLLETEPDLNPEDNLSRAFAMARQYHGIKDQPETQNNAPDKARHAQANVQGAAMRASVGAEPVPYNPKTEIERMRQERLLKFRKTG